MLALLSSDAQCALLELIDARIEERLTARDRQPGMNSPWLTVAEAADYLRTSTAAIYKRHERGQLPAYHPEGSRLMFRREDLDALDLAGTRS